MMDDDVAVARLARKLPVVSKMLTTAPRYLLYCDIFFTYAVRFFAGVVSSKPLLVSGQWPADKRNRYDERAATKWALNTTDTKRNYCGKLRIRQLFGMLAEGDGR